MNRRSLLINISLLLFSTIFALVLSEVTLRLLGFKPMYVSPERDQFWKYDEVLGWVHQPGQQGVFESPEFHTSVRINEKGLRDRSHSYERQDNTKRILLLGDSFAWGYGVEETERFSQLIEKSMRVEVINAAVSGYSTDQELLWYKNEGTQYDTDLVIVALTGNDVSDNARDLVSTIYYKPQFRLENGKLVPAGYPVPKTGSRGRFVYSLSQRSALGYFLVQRYFEAVSAYHKTKVNSEQTNSPASARPPAPAEKADFKLTIALLDEIRNLAESRKAKFMIVATNRWWSSPPGETYPDFISMLRAEGFLVLDVETMPGFDPEVMMIPNDGHWNQAGHEFVAKEIKAFIESNELVSQAPAK